MCVCVCVCVYIYMCIYIYIYPIYKWVQCSPMAWETGVQSEVEPYQRFKKWYLMLPCSILIIIRYISRVK